MNVQAENSYDRINKHGMEAVSILAKIFGHDLAWFEHIILEHMNGAKGCKCTNFDAAGEVRDYCDKWQAVKNLKAAEKELERARQAHAVATANLDTTYGQ